MLKDARNALTEGDLMSRHGKAALTSTLGAGFLVSLGVSSSGAEDSPAFVGMFWSPLKGINWPPARYVW